jgi:hypothetical protein
MPESHFDPLSHRGVRMQGIELSAAIVAQLRAQYDTSNIDVTIGLSRLRRFAMPQHAWSRAAASLLRTTFQSSDAVPLARPFMYSQ